MSEETMMQILLRHGDAKLVARFVSKVSVDIESGCWIWTGYKDRDGYGQVGHANAIDGRVAHRFSFMCAYGAIEKGKQLDHKCRNRSCVNPDHLEAVTGAENVHRGDMCKLSKRDIAQIRTRRAAGESYRSIARDYPVTRTNIVHICSGKSWRS